MTRLLATDRPPWWPRFSSTLVLFGVARLLTQIPTYSLEWLAVWLVVAVVVSDGVVALPMIYLRGGQPVSKTILQQDFGANLALLLAVIAGLTLLAYGVRVVRDRIGPRPE